MEPQTPSEQAPVASLTDRIGSIFGGEKPAPPVPDELPPQEANEPTPDAEAASEEVPEQSATPPAEETFELEIEGEKFTLPKKLEKGFLQEKDYTQKSQSLAEQRKNAELVLEQARIARLNEQFATETSQEQEQLRALDWALQQPVDWNSMTTDEAFRRKLQLDQWKDERGRIERTLGEKRQQFGQKVQAEFAKLRQQSIEAISKRIPGWNDTTAKTIREHALQEGYTETELNSIIDPRHVSTLWKAQQYDLLKAKATPAATAARSVKTTPTNPMPQHVKEKLNYRKSIQRTAPNSPERKQAVEARVASIFSR
jgi:hypothetical protein